MLSSAAERVYWLARYLERVENTARLINVHTGLLMDMPREVEMDWFTLVNLFNAEDLYHSHYEQINENHVMNFLLTDSHYSASLMQTLTALRENARTALDILPEETWEQVNELYLQVKNELPAISNRRRRQNLLLAIMERCQTVWGILTNHMSRNHAYHFLQTAKHLERADMTSRILEMASLILAENRSDSVRAFDGILWAHLLRALSAKQMYTYTYNSTLSAEQVLHFLIRDAAFPRSLFFSLNALERYLSALPNAEHLLFQQQQVLADFFLQDRVEIPAEELHQRMDSLQIQLAELNTKISQQWFYPDRSVT